MAPTWAGPGFFQLRQYLTKTYMFPFRFFGTATFLKEKQIQQSVFLPFFGAFCETKSSRLLQSPFFLEATDPIAGRAPFAFLALVYL